MAVRDVQGFVDALLERPDDQGISLAPVVMHRGEVVADRELVVVHLGNAPAEQRHHVVRHLMAVVDVVPGAVAPISGR